MTRAIEYQNSATTTTAYSYDADNQLTNDGTASTYDANGNRTGGSYGVTTGNQMSADVNWTYSYDTEGNLKQKDSKVNGSSAHWIYVYNASNELTEVRQYSFSGVLAKTIDYKYDAFGNLLEEDVTPAGSGTTTSRFVFDGSNPAHGWVHAGIDPHRGLGNVGPSNRYWRRLCDKPAVGLLPKVRRQ